MDKIFHIDLNMTRRCNMDCSYCFAKSAVKSDFTKIDNFIDFVERVFDSKVFRDNYDILNIGFWGGEPTLQLDSMIKIMQTFIAAPDIKFFIYSNGLKIPSFLKHFLERTREIKVGTHPKVCMQISYDGGIVHDLQRNIQVTNSKSAGTASRVKDSIYWLNYNRVPFVIKSTITPSNFLYMYGAYEDILKLRTECEHVVDNHPYRNINYFPTIDYYNLDKNNQNQCKELESSLIKIARCELKLRRPIFKWFQSNRALCTAGRDMIAVDTNGDIHVCHGCFYDQAETGGKHILGKMEDNFDSIMNSLFYSDVYEEEYKGKERECEDCKVSFCLRCNHAKFINSNKSFYLSKWTDYTNQPMLCRFYKVNDLVRQGYEYLRRKK